MLIFNILWNVLHSTLYAKDESSAGAGTTATATTGAGKDPAATNTGKPAADSKNKNKNGRNGKPQGNCQNGKPNRNGKPDFDGIKDRWNKNALAWHNKDRELFAMATHISQFKLAGKQITPTYHTELLTLGNRIVAYDMAITPGTVIGTQDPFNKAVIDLFNRVRGKYTSQVPFQANDLGTVILAIASVISLFGAADRVLDNLGYISFKSALTPEILHAALVGDVNNATIKAGYDADVYQAPNIKLALEIQIRRLQGLFMPKMALFDFAGWIYRHVFFEDKTGIRGDMSLFRPSYIAKWSPTIPVAGATGVYASGLEYKDINSYLSSPNPHDLRMFLAAITDCIDVLVQDDNVRTICGWLHQYLPDSPTIADLVQSSREFNPDENPEMDLFIAGLTMIPSSNFTGTYVQQDVTKECLYFTMSAQTPMAPVENWMINYDHAPSDDEVGLSLVFTALEKDGYVYSDPFVAVNESHYRRDETGAMTVSSTTRTWDASIITSAQVLEFQEGKHPTALYYSMSSGVMYKASLVADCAYQVRVTPDNAYNLHYASLTSLMYVDAPKPR